jgi:hypothetical protein
MTTMIGTVAIQVHTFRGNLAELTLELIPFLCLSREDNMSLWVGRRQGHARHVTLRPNATAAASEKILIVSHSRNGEFTNPIEKDSFLVTTLPEAGGDARNKPARSMGNI